MSLGRIVCTTAALVATFSKEVAAQNCTNANIGPTSDQRLAGELLAGFMGTMALGIAGYGYYSVRKQLNESKQKSQLRAKEIEEEIKELEEKIKQNEAKMQKIILEPAAKTPSDPLTINLLESHDSFRDLELGTPATPRRM